MTIPPAPEARRPGVATVALLVAACLLWLCAELTVGPEPRPTAPCHGMQPCQLAR